MLDSRGIDPVVATVLAVIIVVSIAIVLSIALASRLRDIVSIYIGSLEELSIVSVERVNSTTVELDLFNSGPVGLRIIGVISTPKEYTVEWRCKGSAYPTNEFVEGCLLESGERAQLLVRLDASRAFPGVLIELRLVSESGKEYPVLVNV